jgi:hypothetical protein
MAVFLLLILGPARRKAIEPDFGPLIVARNRLDTVNHLLVRDVLGGTDEGRVPTIHEDRQVAVGVPAQGREQTPPFHFDERSEIHVHLLWYLK